MNTKKVQVRVKPEIFYPALSAASESLDNQLHTGVVMIVWSLKLYILLHLLLVSVTCKYISNLNH